MIKPNINGIGLYALSVLMVSGSNFITTPLLIGTMLPSEFSRWALLEPILMALIPLAGLGINVGLLNKLSVGTLQPKIGFSELFPFQLGFSCFMAAVVYAVTFSTSAVGPRLAMFCALVIVTEGSLLFLQAYWRSLNQPLYFIVVDGLRAVFLLSAIYIVTRSVPPTSFVVSGYLALRTGFAAVALVWGLLLIRPSWAPNKAQILSAIRYGLPITIASFMSTWLLNIDRYAVIHYGNAAELTGYVAHARIAQLLPIGIMAPFFLWFAPRAMRALAQGGTSLREISNITSIYVSILLWASINLWLVMPPIWHLFFPSVQFNPLLYGINVVSASVFSLANPFSVGTLREKKTHAAVLISAISLITVTLATFSLGAIAGIVGVALGKVVGLFSYVALFTGYTIRTTKISYNWKLILASILYFLVMITLLCLFDFGNTNLAYFTKLLLMNTLTACAAWVYLTRVRALEP